MKPVKTKKQYYKRRERYKLISGGSRFLVRAFITLYVIMLVCGGLYGVYVFQGMVEDAPELGDDILSNAETSLIVDVEGNTLMELGVSKVENLPKNEMSEDIKDAVTGVEDKRFYEHHGFDIIRLGKAVETTLRGNFGAEGGSTLTQQLVKISYLDQYEDSLSRKAQELYLAWKMEEEYSKDEILNMYINKVYMGNGIYGMRTASYYYYGKDIHDLEPYELAVIVGTPNRPEDYNPYGHEESAKNRRDTVLYIFNQDGKISDEQFAEYVELPISTNLITKEENQNREFENLNQVEGYLATPVNDAIKEAETQVEDLYTGGYTIRTTINKDKQKYGYDLVTKDKSNGGYISYPDDEIMVSITVLNNETGEVEFMEGGSRNTVMDVHGFNYVTDLQRQPGSSIKPILDFAPYIESGGSPKDMVLDAPVSYTEGGEIFNYFMDYKGNMTVQRALEESRNTPAYRLMMQVGVDYAYDFANKLGMGYTPEERLESGSLGGLSNANPYIMARAFSVFPNSGEYKEYNTVTAIEDSQGQLIYRNQKSGESVMSAEGASKMTTMLRAVITSDYGTAPELKIKERYIAGKTGTTNYSDDEVLMYNVPDRGAPDVWFVGYDKKYTVAVWVGYEDRSGVIVLEDQDLAKEVALDVWKNYIKESNPIK